MKNLKKKIKITTDFITLGQFIKLTNILESGGMVKSYLKDVGVLLNGEKEHRRGKKLFPGDNVEIENVGTFIVDK